MTSLPEAYSHSDMLLGWDHGTTTDPPGYYEEDLDFLLTDQVNNTQRNPSVTYLIVSYSQNRLIFKSILVFWVAISLFGTLGNGLNIWTFIKMGTDDSVTISFMVLSVSDMILLLFAFIHACAVIPSILVMERGFWFYFDPTIIVFLCAHIREMFGLNNSIITSFLAIQRCFCIARPLHFKGAFTRSRAAYVLLMAAAFSLLCYMPVLSLPRVALRPDRRLNKTKLTISFTPGWSTAVKFNETLAGILAPCVTQLIVLLCLIVMARGLKKSAQFRNRAALSEKTGENVTNKSHDPAKTTSEAKPSTKQQQGKGQTVLSKKDTNVLMQVLLICIIFVICNTPKIGIAVARLVIPGFDHGGKLQFLYTALKYIRTAFELTNSAVNTFIYFKYNSKFRITLSQNFTCFGKEQNNKDG